MSTTRKFILLEQFLATHGIIIDCIKIDGPPTKWRYIPVDRRQQSLLAIRQGIIAREPVNHLNPLGSPTLEEAKHRLISDLMHSELLVCHEKGVKTISFKEIPWA